MPLLREREFTRHLPRALYLRVIHTGLQLVSQRLSPKTYFAPPGDAFLQFWNLSGVGLALPSTRCSFGV